MKRIGLRFVCLFVMTALLLTLSIGCTKTEKDGETDSGSDTQATSGNDAGKSEEEKEFSYPIEGNRKITYWMPLNSSITQKYNGIEDTPYGKQLQKNLGVDIEYTHPAAGQEDEQFNLLAASGDYPDIIEYDINKYVGGPEKAIEDGVILDLTKYMPQYAPNLMEVYSRIPEAEKLSKTDSGKLYSFPYIRDGVPIDGVYQGLVFFGPIVNSVWLKDLGLDDPETMDEWYAMLKAFRDEKGATAPLTYQSWMLTTGNGSPFLGAYGATFDFYVDDSGDVQYGPIQPGYKEFLQEFSKWYAEGLLDPDIATVDNAQVAAKMTTGKSGASLGWRASRLGAWSQAAADNPDIDFKGVRFPAKKKGEKPMFSQKDAIITGYSAYVSTGCKDIELAMRVLDYNYSEEGSMLNNFGIEDESYTMVNGVPTFTDLIVNNPEGLGQSAASSFYMRYLYQGPLLCDPRSTVQNGMSDVQKEATANWSYSDVDKYKLPSVTPKTDESQEVAVIMNEIKTYVDQMYVTYLFGQEDLSSFDSYVKNIRDMNIDKVLGIYKEALTRFNNR